MFPNMHNVELANIIALRDEVAQEVNYFHYIRPEVVQRRQIDIAFARDTEDDANMKRLAQYWEEQGVSTYTGFPLPLRTCTRAASHLS